MKHLNIIFAILLTLSGLSGQAMAAGTCSIGTLLGDQIQTITWTCTPDAGNGTIPSTYASPGIKGWVFAVDTTPGTTPPTASTGFTLITSDTSADVMGGNASAMLGSTAGRAVPAKSGWVNGATLTPTFSGSYGTSVSAFTIKVSIWHQKQP